MPGFTPTFFYLTGGLIVWAVRFLAVYIIVALACARGWAEATFLGLRVVDSVPILATILGVAACLALILTAVARLRALPAGRGAENSRFVHVVAALIAGIAILAMVFETAPVFFLASCAA